MKNYLVATQAVALLSLTACNGAHDCPEGSRRIGSACRIADSVSGEDGGANQESDASCVGMDDDGDGYGAADDVCANREVDCDDTDPDVRPGASDVCGDQIDNDCDGVTDEGALEVCNGADDDCDGALDEGVTTAFYEDLDGDGFGTGVASYACSSPAATAPVDGDCDDSNLAVSPSLAELCDGLDNDCNTSVDEAFACAQNQSTSCETSCGSTGEGLCTALCELPEGEDCVAPPEVCNWRDDDCDGLVDQQQVTDLKDYRLLTVPGPTSSTTGAGSVPRTGGGAWILGEYNKAGGVYAQKLGTNGESLGGAPSLLEQTAGTSKFRAVGDGTHVVLATNTYSLPRSTVVSVLRADDLSLIAETTIDNATLYAASLIEGTSGELHILVVDEDDDERKPFAHVLHLGSEGAWLPPSPPILLQGLAFPDAVVAARIPCRDEWLVTTYQWEDVDAEIAKAVLFWRVTSSGNLVGNTYTYALYGQDNVTGIGTRASDCTRDPEIMLGYGQKASFIRVNRGSGALSFNQNTLDMGSDFHLGTFLFWGGRWWAAGSRGPAPYKALLAELLTGKAPRWIELSANGAPHPGDDSIAERLSQIGFLDLGNKLAITFNRGQEGANLDAIHSAQSPDDPNLPVAVTYLFGCP